MADERIFTERMKSWGVVPNEYSKVVLDCGIGDHYAFKSVLGDYFIKNKGKQHLFFLCYPEVFKELENREDVKIGSIAEAGFMGPIDEYNIYKWMWDHNWKRPLKEAFEKMYHLPGGYAPEKVVNGTGNTIVISPYSQTPDHPKSYPYWEDMVRLLKSETPYKIVQIGRVDEKKIDGIDEYYWGLNFIDIADLIRECKTWISVDNFLPHLINSMDTSVRGTVLFGLSDPRIFGYNYNKNLLKSEQFLRLDQFNIWGGITRNDSIFLSATEVLAEVLSL
jgi:hypothetical protein